MRPKGAACGNALHSSAEFSSLEEEHRATSVSHGPEEHGARGQASLAAEKKLQIYLEIIGRKNERCPSLLFCHRAPPATNTEHKERERGHTPW